MTYDDAINVLSESQKLKDALRDMYDNGRDDTLRDLSVSKAAIVMAERRRILTIIGEECERHGYKDDFCKVMVGIKKRIEGGK